MSSTWKRRQFLTSSAAVAVSFGLSRHALPEVLAGREQAALPAPTVITGGVKPLLETNTARPLRYTPDGTDFVIRNGSEFFNRPLYGSNSDFRVDAGDRPEFSLYLPGHGGNLKLGLLSGPHSKWLAEADVVVARYRLGRMIYEINDALLGAATLRLELMTAGAGSGLLLRVDAQQTPSKSSLFWAFAGASGRKGRRNGDIGCEAQPVSEFFQVRREECSGNRYSLDEAGSSARLVSAFCELQFTFPHATQLKVGDFAVWGSAVPRMQAETGSTQNPILLGATEMRDEPLFLAIDRVTAGAPLAAIDLQPSYDARSKQLEAIAGHVAIESPDPYLNPIGPALSIVADALWDSEQGCVMHGCVAWRVALAGWRGPYVLDATGSHDRAKTHFRHWIARQNTSPITTADPATGPADPNTHLARKEHLLHSNGDLSGNHYDMNLVFFDVLLRHLRWTGDLEFAKEIWPAYKRHLAWEQRLFRRTFKSASGQELPLYEAYAAIWASDNLQYSGGGTAHASAYNIFSFREAGKIARLLGEDPQPYESEAMLIRQALEELLWQPQSGAFAEAKDLMGEQTVYTNPGLWTIYHAIDSEVPSPRQAWQMAAERLAVLKRIPVHGEGLPDGGFMLSCSDWLPYLWSLNLLVLAENMHFALALWQAGLADEAYRLFRGNLFDSMYQGLCPGDFHMTSQLDVHRQEAQRDFGDPTGITSRALVEGLFGVRPHLLEGRIDVRPGFPATWNHAALHHTDFDLAWRRNAAVETYTFSNRFTKRATLRLSLPARTTKLPHITSNGEAIACRFDKDVIGAPRVLVEVPASRRVTLELLWKGESPLAAPAHRSYGLGDVLALPPGVQLSQVDDPQGCLHRGRVTRRGTHIVFANVHQGECSFALPITFDGGPAELPWSAVPMASEAAHTEPVDLSSVLSHRISEIFTRGYMEPRSPLCTLSIPDNLLGGWANIESNPPQIDDTGLRRAGGLLQTPLNVGFLTPSDEAPNCIFLSFFKPDHESFTHSITGRASGIYLLMTGTTLPQCSRMQHAVFTIEYTDGSRSSLPLRNPETWWPVEQDYLIDDYLFVNAAPVPPRVDLSSGRTRLVQAASFKGEGRRVPGGAATILYLALDPAKSLAAMRLDVNLYGIVVALLAATLVRA